MSTLNADGIRMVNRRTRPLAVATLSQAADVIRKEIEKGPAPGVTPAEWARHLAWVIGFDVLCDDRHTIHEVTKLVADPS